MRKGDFRQAAPPPSAGASSFLEPPYAVCQQLCRAQHTPEVPPTVVPSWHPWQRAGQDCWAQGADLDLLLPPSWLAPSGSPGETYTRQGRARSLNDQSGHHGSTSAAHSSGHPSPRGPQHPLQPGSPHTPLVTAALSPARETGLKPHGQGYLRQRTEPGVPRPWRTRVRSGDPRPKANYHSMTGWV